LSDITGTQRLSRHTDRHRLAERDRDRERERGGAERVGERRQRKCKRGEGERRVTEEKRGPFVALNGHKGQRWGGTGVTHFFTWDSDVDKPSGMCRRHEVGLLVTREADGHAWFVVATGRAAEAMPHATSARGV
jgi:hypothetical protein